MFYGKIVTGNSDWNLGFIFIHAISIYQQKKKIMLRHISEICSRQVPNGIDPI